MFANKTRTAWWVVIATVGSVGLGWSILEAQQDQTPAVETLLPADAIVYFGMDGMETHKEAWEKTAAYEALYKTGLMEAIEKLISGFSAAAGPDAGAAKQAYELIAQKGLSFAVALPGDVARPLPYATIVLHEAASLEPAVSNVMNTVARGQLVFEPKDIDGKQVTVGTVPLGSGLEAEVGWWTAGKHLVLVAGFDAVKQTLSVAAGQKPNITTSPHWKKYREQKPDFEMASLFWFDFGALRNKFGDFPVNIPGQERLVKVNELIQALGLDKLGALALQSGYKGRAQWIETSLEAPSPRTGLLALGGQQSMTLDSLPPLPFGNSGFYACSVDWTKFYDGLIQVARDVAKLGPPEAAAQLDQMVGQAGAMFGFDLRSELFEPLGNSICLYGDSRQGMFGMGLGLALKVDDAKTLRTTFNKILDRAAGFAPPGQLAVVRKQKQGREIVMMQIAGGVANPSFGIDDKWMVVGLFPQVVEAFFLRVDGKLTNWTPTQSYREAFDAMPKEFVSISSSDPRKMYRAIVGLAPAVLPAIQAGMQQFGLPGGMSDFSAADLPPAELVGRPLFPNVAVCTVDDAGYHWTSRSSLPAIPFIDSGGGGTITTVAILAGLLLPAVQQAREAARRTQSKNNIKQMMLAMHNYHETSGSFPAGTHPNEKLETDKRLSWLTDILPFVDEQGVHSQIDFEKSWDDEANQNAVQTKLEIFQNPGTVEQNTEPVFEGAATTHYVGIGGLGKEGPTLPVDDKKAGLFAYNRVTKILDVLDGTSNTFAVSEASKDFGPWAAGGKATVRALTTKPYINGPDGIGGPFSGGCQFGLVDGSVRFVSGEVDPSVLEAASTINGGEAIGNF